MNSVSIEVGHFYDEAISQGSASLAERFALIRPLAQVVSKFATDTRTVFLIDDYHNRPDAGPDKVIPTILEAAATAGVDIDYLAREAACTRLASSLLDKLIERGKIIQRDCYAPDTQDYSTDQDLLVPEAQGWLADRTPSGEFGAALAPCRHTDIIPRICPAQADIEIYSQMPKGKGRLWSCPLLATVWQGLRMRVLADSAFDQPYMARDGALDWYELGGKWDNLPPLIQLNPRANPFAAQRTFSILPANFMQVEVAVQRIAAATFPEAANHISYAFLAEI